LPLLDEPGPQIARGIAGVASSPDGRRTAFTALGDLWLSERGALRRLTDDVWVDLDPTFSPDGGSVVFASERSGQFELWRIDVRGGAPSQVTFGALEPRRPTVSGDGRRVAFMETEAQGPGGHERLSVAELAQPGRVATVATGLSGARASWGADGKTLTLRVAAAPTAAVAGVRFEIGAERPAAAAAEAPARKAHPNAQPLGDVRWAPPAAPEDYVVEVGRLFDAVRAEYRRHVDVHVSGGRIAAIVGRGVLPTPAKVIDARDATVVPGFVDVHAHQSALAGERVGRMWLAYGVTTVRELAPDVAEAVERGEVWASGRSPGPRLVVSPAAGAPEPTPSLNASTLVPVRAYPGISSGVGHTLARLAHDPTSRAFDSSSTRRESRTGPAPYELELSPDLVSYQDVFATLTASFTVLPSGLGVIAGLQGWPDQPARGGARGRDTAYSSLFTPAERAAWGSSGSAPGALPRLQQTVARLVRAGGRVAIGSDAPAVPYGLGVHFDLALIAGAGVPNDQALRIATAEGALALGLERQIGTLEEGKIADFIVIDGDPLERLSDTLRITAVVRGGVWMDRASLLVSP
jgi:hypothetical protein